MIDKQRTVDQTGLSAEQLELLTYLSEEEGITLPYTQTISPRGALAALPLSFPQQRLWFLAHLELESPFYNEPKAVRIRGALDVRLLQQTLDAVVARHEALRATFVAVDGTPMQVIIEKQAVALPMVDLRGSPEATREAEMQRRLTEAIQRPFDLTRDVLLRALLVYVRDEEHVLLLVTHHIASDGWSPGVLWRDIAAFYMAFAKGEPMTLPELPVQCADYALWQHQWRQGERLQSDLAYWKQQLVGAPPLLELPMDHPRPAMQTWTGRRQTWVFPASLTSDLVQLSRQVDGTLFMTLLAAFQTLLYRYTGQEDIVVGAPIASRTRKETEDVIGFFVNTLALRTHFAGNPTFRELLGRVREMALEAYVHQDLPFEKLVEELQPERSLSYAPLVQVMFSFQNVPLPSVALHGLTVQRFEVEHTIAKFDLTLFMWEAEGTLRAEWEYNTDLFEADTITRIAGHFQTLLEGIVAHADQMVATVPLLTEAERHQMLVSWNATQTAYPKVLSLPQLFEAQVERTPDAVAVVFDEAHLTYRELNRRANQLAHHLRTLGVEPEVRVGICVECSLEMVVGLLGILKAGGVYVPLDPTYPPERLAFTLADAQMPVLLTQRRLVEHLAVSQVHVCRLDTDWEAIARANSANPASEITGENLAYVIYTSGSTGKPKGVQVPSRALVNFLHAMCQRPGLTQHDTFLAVTTISFDIAALELFLPLLVGARVVIVPREVASDGAQLLRVLTSAGVTVMQATPVTWRLLLEAGWQGGTRLTMLCGGEAFPWSLAKQLLARGDCLWNMYGPTETTIWSAVHKVEPEDGAVVIGHPIANTQLYVLDAHLQPVPIGVPGELYIGGDGVARGYLNRPDLTAECFLPDPFSAVPGACLYKTGDLVRRLPEGSIEFLGRLDHQVKLRGYRIELGEVEAVLQQYPGMREVVVLMREDTPGEQRLVAYLVGESRLSSNINAIRSFTQARLPAYMGPAAFVPLDDLPLTPNGKVDRRALPAPERTRPELEKNFVAPRSDLERQLVQIWEPLLGVQPIGIQDNFFELGGHSLLAVHIFAQMEKTFRSSFPLALLYQAPTIAQLATLLREQQPLPPSRLLAFRTGGTKPLFFSVHFGGGHLAHYVEDDQPWYGLHLPSWDGHRNPRTVEAIATEYIHRIRTLQPEGPYFLGGYSFGGIVAFEMAHQLHRQGQAVALLVLVDPMDWRGGTRGQHTVIWYLKGLARKMVWMAGESYLALGRRIPPRLRQRYTTEMNLQTVRTYVPQTYPGRLVLFQATQNGTDVRNTWGPLAADGFELYQVPGDHFTLFEEPHVHVFLAQLMTCLRQVQACLPEAGLVTPGLDRLDRHNTPLSTRKEIIADDPSHNWPRHVCVHR